MRVRCIPVLALLGVLAVSATGCQQVLKALTPPPVIKHVTIKAKVGTPNATVTGTLVQGYPSSLPLWDGASVLRTRMVKSKSAGSSWSTTLSTTDPYDDVVKGMAAGFQQQGWTVAQEDLPSTVTSTTALTVMASSGTGIVTISSQKDATTRIDYVIALSGK